MRVRHVLFTLAVATLSLSRQAAAQFPIAPLGTEGLSVFVTGNNPIIATYLGNSAAYSNDLYLMLLANGLPGDDGILSNDRFIFNNHTSPVGSTANLGAFTLGSELIFRLYVQPTGENWLTGPGTRNADGKAHARVQANWQPTTTLVSFEDLVGTPEFPGGYNDLSYSFTNTSAVLVTPEPATLALLGAGLGTLLLVRRRARR